MNAAADLPSFPTARAFAGNVPPNCRPRAFDHYHSTIRPP
jgi:hypothetical protein